MSETKIAVVTMKRRKQIAGIITRSPYANRSAMTAQERQMRLDELLEIRVQPGGGKIDGGVLDRVPFKVIQLHGKQVKARGGAR